MDSVQLMNASLDTLITNLNQSRDLLRIQQLIKHTEVDKASVILFGETRAPFKGIKEAQTDPIPFCGPHYYKNVDTYEKLESKSKPLIEAV